MRTGGQMAGNPPRIQPPTLFNHALGLTEYCCQGGASSGAIPAMTASPCRPGASPSFRRTLMTGVLLVPVALALAGCAKPEDTTDPTMTGAVDAAADRRRTTTRPSPIGATATRRTRRTRAAAMNYASALIHTGQRAAGRGGAAEGDHLQPGRPRRAGRLRQGAGLGRAARHGARRDPAGADAGPAGLEADVRARRRSSTRWGRATRRGRSTSRRCRSCRTSRRSFPTTACRTR